MQVHIQTNVQEICKVKL